MVRAAFAPVQGHGEDLEKDGSGYPGALSTIQDFWDRTTELKNVPLPYRFECDVTYYDEEWGALWVQDGTSGAYVVPGVTPFPARSGQRIRVTGVFPAGTSALSFAGAGIEVLGPAVMPPVPVTDGIDRFSELRDCWVSVVGYVDRQETTTPVPSHVHLYLSAYGRVIWAWLVLPDGQPPPNLVGSSVRVRGVYVPKFTPDRRLASVELMIPSPSDIEVVSALQDDSRFERPAKAVSDLPTVSPKELVRVLGRVVAQESGRYLRIRDDSGQVDLMTGQTRLCPVNEWVEAIGYPLINGTDWRLDDALFRPYVGAVEGGVALSGGIDRAGVVRLAAAVMNLAPDEAMKAPGVELEGVITWSNPNTGFFYLQDSSGGVCVFLGAAPDEPRNVGRSVEVRGSTWMGEYAPVVIAREIEKLGDSMLPQSRPVPLERALTGVEEAQWVEMRGYVRAIRPSGKWTRLELTTTVGDFAAEVPAGDDVSACQGAVVRLYGVCTAVADQDRRLEGILLRVPSSAYIQIEEPAPADVFDLPTRAVSSVGQFGTAQTLSRRMKVTGLVLDYVPGHGFYIQQDEDALYVATRETAPLEPGDIVETVGFPGRQGFRPTLREAVYRKIGHGSEPLPVPVSDFRVADRMLDGRLVELDATLTTPPVHRDGVHLTLQSGGVVFEAMLDSSSAGARAGGTPWKPGSELRLTGVYEVIADEYGNPRTFQVRLRRPSDVVVLEEPPWLTVRVVTLFASVLGFGAAAAAGWVVALRRRVRRQTEQIRAQLVREARLEAELQRTSRLESLGILAGGIAHDFNNLLTVVMGNISIAQLDEGLQPDSADGLRDAEKAVVRARDLTQQLLTFAKGGAPIRAAVALADVVREVARFATHGSNVRCDFTLQEDLWPADVDKGQVSQVVQNIVINAVQAMPGGGAIRVGLRNVNVGGEMGETLRPGRYVELTLADQGAGITPENLQRIFDPYFSTKEHGMGLGLATVYSIVKRHHGHVSVESERGVGTTFTIWLPAAEEEPLLSPATVAGVSVDGRRALFMDDEEAIRRMGAKLLGRLGLEVVCVPDGAAAVDAFEHARAEGNPFDLVVLDLTVPGGMGGRQAMERLLAIDPDVRAIVSSGYSNDPVLANYRAHGFRAMVSKPYEVADFRQKVFSVLEKETA